VIETDRDGEDLMGLAKPGDPKYTTQVIAGLITDEKVLAEERRRRAIPPKPAAPPIKRAAKRPAPRWIQIGGQS
jgi:hypothetical protein